MDKEELELALDESPGRRPSAPLFWAIAASLTGLWAVLLNAEDSLNSVAARFLGAAAALGYGAGASDAFVGVALGLVSACIFFALLSAGWAVGYLLFARRYPDSNIATIVATLLAIAAVRLVGRGALDQALGEASARHAHTTEVAAILLVLGVVFVVVRIREKSVRSNDVAAPNPPAWDPFDVTDEHES